jgi:hypothetical protein
MDYRKPIRVLALIGFVVLAGYNARGLAHAPAFGLPQQFVFPGNDLVVYLRAGQAVWSGDGPYVTEPWTDPAVFHYSPAIAAITAQVVGRTTGFGDALPFRLLALLYWAVIVICLPVAWIVWRRVFSIFLPNSPSLMTAWLPVWLIYSQWFADQNYLNIYTVLMVLTGALTLAIARERSWLAVLLAALILQTKPHYAFPLILPLLLGNWRYFIKLLAGTATAYLAVAGATVLAVGPPYGLALYDDYARFLTSIQANYPWSSYYLGYNHSWYSIVHWIFGIRPWASIVVTAIKIVSFIPVGWLGWRVLRGRITDRPIAALGLALALHLWSMTLLDQLWEVSLAIVAFMYLLATAAPAIRRAAILIGVPFALLGLAQLAGWGAAILVDSSMEQLDITARVPLLMAAALGLCALVLVTIERRNGVVRESPSR